MKQTPIPNEVYPFYLIENKPFMKIGKRQAVVYWGAVFSFGKGEPFTIAESKHDLEEPSGSNSTYNPDLYTAHYNTLTDFVLGHAPFRFQSFTIDLSQNTIAFYEGIGQELLFKGKKAYCRPEAEAILIMHGKVDGTELVLQLDIGDELTTLPEEVLRAYQPVGEHTLYLMETDAQKTTVPIYEVPIRLSYELTITVRARALVKGEEGLFSAIGSHGCLGVDLIRKHPVTFHFEWDPRTSRHHDVIYVHDTPFKAPPLL